MKYKIILLAIVILIACLIVFQKKQTVAIPLNWQMLGKLSFKSIWYEPYKTRVNMPVFPDTLEKLNGKRVKLTGFYIPMELNSNKCALSRNPNSTCFFCGRATIETIVIVNFSGNMPGFDGDELITVEGRFELKNTFNDFLYQLEDAHYVGSNQP